MNILWIGLFSYLSKMNQRNMQFVRTIALIVRRKSCNFYNINILII